MAAEDAGDVVVVLQFGDQRAGIGPGIEMARIGPDRDLERRMMQEQAGGPGGIGLQHPADMVEPFPAQPALAGALIDRIDDDQPDCEILDGILHEGHIRPDMAAVGEDPGEVPPVVAIAGQNEIRCRQAVEQRPHGPVFLDAPVVGNIAGMDDGVGLRLQAVDPGDAGFEIGRALRPVVGDVGVGEMDDPHGLHRKGKGGRNRAGCATG